MSDQRLAHRARHQERAAEIDFHDPVPVLIRHAHQQLIVRHARVVDQDVDTPEMLLRRADEPLAILAARRVGDDTEHRPALRFPFANGAL